MLTPEARVLIYLMLNGPATVTSAMQESGTSSRNFYAVLERLKQAQLVAAVRDEQDHRVRRLNLDPSGPLTTVASDI
jgi:DNA-binding MarR family transcriptional regulator